MFAISMFVAQSTFAVRDDARGSSALSPCVPCFRPALSAVGLPLLRPKSKPPCWTPSLKGHPTYRVPVSCVRKETQCHGQNCPEAAVLVPANANPPTACVPPNPQALNERKKCCELSLFYRVKKKGTEGLNSPAGSMGMRCMFLRHLYPLFSPTYQRARLHLLGFPDI